MQSEAGLLVAFWLFENKISGTLPQELGPVSNDSCSFLGASFTYLLNFFGGSSLVSELPEFCGRNGPTGNATASLSLQFGSTLISGTIPPRLIESFLLLQLDLSEMALSGSLPHNSGSVAAMSLSGNRFSGTIPGSLVVGSKSDEQTASNGKKLVAWFNHLLMTSGLNISFPGTEAFLTSILTATLNVARNNLSGSLPNFDNDTLLIQFAANENSISGHIWPTTLPWCYLYDVGGNSLSGSIGSQISTWSSLEFLMVGNNQFSATLSSELGSLTALHVVDLSFNLLTGSNPPELQRWKELTLISVSDNSNLNWNLSQLVDWPKLQHALMANCSIDGVLPNDLPPQLNSLLLSYNTISSSIGSTFDDMNQLQLLDLSSNFASGSIPQKFFCSTRAQNVLLNNMRISGSLPACSQSNLSMYSTLSTLSVARNYFSGSTDALGQSSNLSTLVLASNFFTSNMVTIDKAIDLGSDQPYQDPAERTLLNVGAQVKKNATRTMMDPRLRAHPIVVFTQDVFNLIGWAVPNSYLTPRTYAVVARAIKFQASNPFSSLNPIRNYSKLVLAFAGNTFVTQQASYIPYVQSGNVLEHDIIRHGGKQVFTGDSDFYMTLCVMVPLVLLFHAATILKLVGRKRLCDYYYLTSAARDAMQILAKKSHVRLMCVWVEILNLCAALFSCGPM